MVVYYCLRALYSRSAALHQILIDILHLLIKRNMFNWMSRGWQLI